MFCNPLTADLLRVRTVLYSHELIDWNCNDFDDINCFRTYLIQTKMDINIDIMLLHDCTKTYMSNKQNKQKRLFSVFHEIEKINLLKLTAVIEKVLRWLTSRNFETNSH